MRAKKQPPIDHIKINPIPQAYMLYTQSVDACHYEWTSFTTAYGNTNSNRMCIVCHKTIYNTGSFNIFFPS